MRRLTVSVLVVLLLVAPLAGVAAAGSDADAGATPSGEEPPSQVHETPGSQVVESHDDPSSIRRTMTLSLTPDRPGSVDANVTFHLPDTVRSLETTVPAGATVFETNEFTHVEGSTYEWTGDGTTPSLSFHVPANRTGIENRRPTFDTPARSECCTTAVDTPTTTSRHVSTTDGQYSFVDAGQWAIVTVPQLGTRWSWSETDPTVSLEKRLETAGPGATGGEIAYLGPHETYTRSANGQSFRLVVPDAAAMHADPSTVLDSLGAASDGLRVGARDEAVFFVAAPDSVSWAARGIEYGGSDSWVRADAPLDEPGNVWLHEYVHTRQSFEVENGTRWTFEASAEYYAALLTLRQGRIGFDAFRDYLARGTEDPYRSAVLADPSSWSSLANYLKGALVYGTLDRRTRVVTDSRYTMGDALRRLNGREEPISQSDFLGAVGDVSSPSVRDAAERYTTTDATPDTWTDDEHQLAFGTIPPRMEYRVVDHRVTGPYRTETDDRPPTLVTGERLAVTAVVENVGGTTGPYDAVFVLNGTAVDDASGDLDPGENTTLTLSHTATTPGAYPVRVYGRQYSLTVREPATPTLIDLAASPTRAAVGEPVAVTATVQNPATLPAAGEYALLVDGAQTDTWSPRLDGGARATERFTLTFEEPGTHRVRLGNRSIPIEVSRRTSEGSGADGASGTSTPGFGPVAALLALTSLALGRIVAGRT